MRPYLERGLSEQAGKFVFVHRALLRAGRTFAAVALAACPRQWNGRAQGKFLLPRLLSLSRGQLGFPAKHRAAAELWRGRAFAGDEGIQRWTLRRMFEPSSLVVETLYRLHLFLAAELCVLYRRLQHANGLVIDLYGHGVGVAV